MTKQPPDQQIYIGPLPKGAGRQEVHVNPPGGRPPEPHFAAGTSQLVILVAVGLFLIIIACGVASALTAGAVF